MSPTVRHDPVSFELDAVTPVRTPRRARCYAFAVLAAALALVGALLLGGVALPEPGLLLVLAVPLALCMNRYLFFPNEVGVTADAAVIFAAMVACRGDAQWLGPVMVALLAGPLDARHWGARAFTRMAYNSGSTTLVTAAGLAVFVPLTRELGAGWEAMLAAAAIAAVPYFVSESILGVTLVTLLGERPADAARHQLPLNAIVLPLAIVGAAAGTAAVGVGWWCALLMLLPIPFFPELVLVVLPRRLGVRVAVDLGFAVVGVALVGVSVAVADPVANLVTGLLGLACLVVVENPPRRSALVPPLGAVVVVAPVALVLETSPTTAVLLASAVGAGFLAIARTSDRRSWWSLPLVAFVAALGVADFGSLRVASVAAGVVVALVAAATWGPLPWASRVVGRFAAARCPVVRMPALVLATSGPPVLTVVAVATHGTARTTAALGALALTELGVFAAALAVRLWRFAPRRRARDLVVLGGAAVVSAVISLPLTKNGVPLAVGGATLTALAVALVSVPFTKLNARSSSIRHGRHFVPKCATGTVSTLDDAPDERASPTSLGAPADGRLPPDGDQCRHDRGGPGQA